MTTTRAAALRVSVAPSRRLPGPLTGRIIRRRCRGRTHLPPDAAPHIQAGAGGGRGGGTCRKEHSSIGADGPLPPPPLPAMASGGMTSRVEAAAVLLLSLLRAASSTMASHWQTMLAISPKPACSSSSKAQVGLPAWAAACLPMCGQEGCHAGRAPSGPAFVTL